MWLKLIQFRCFVSIILTFTNAAVSQIWSQLQTANKASGVCPVCKAPRQLYLKDGTLRQHGLRSNRYPGSGQKPLSIAQNLDNMCTVIAILSQQSFPSRRLQLLHFQLVCLPPAQVESLHQTHPKAARSACARTLTSIQSGEVAYPESAKNWQAILDFGFDVLRWSIIGGRRHNLSSVILKSCRGTPSADSLPQQHLQSRRRTAAILRSSRMAVSLGPLEFSVPRKFRPNSQRRRKTSGQSCNMYVEHSLSGFYIRHAFSI
jgi:hypothetical protein